MLFPSATLLLLAIATCSTQAATVPLKRSQHAAKEDDGALGVLVAPKADGDALTIKSDDHPGRKLQALCNFVIATASSNYLNLGEVGIYLTDGGAQVAHSSAVLSSTYDNLGAGNCFDGNTGTVCHTATGDSAPSLTVQWACAGGSALGYEVKVVNRADCCGDRIGGGTFKAYNSNGSSAGPTYTFAASQSNYNIRVGTGTSCWVDGVFCGLDCSNCCNAGSYWYGNARHNCGKEPCYGDGTTCLAGTSCKSCCNQSSYWYGPAITKCGKEPCYSDGTTCLSGTSCNACCRSATFWNGPAITKCGNEPCYGSGTYCLLGSSCNKCCNGYHWYSRCK